MQLVAKAFPQQAAIEKVVEVATDFWRTHPHKHIAIHCAYGEELAAGFHLVEASPGLSCRQHTGQGSHACLTGTCCAAALTLHHVLPVTLLCEGLSTSS